MSRHEAAERGAWRPWLVVNARVVGALGRRAVRQTFRRPQLLAPILLFPTLLLAVQVGGAGSAVRLEGFPQVNGFLDFMLAGAMIQATLLAGNTGGLALAIDIESGFTDRLLAAPIARFSIVLGRLVATAILGFLTAIWFLVIGLAFGVQIQEGIAGALLMIALVTGSAVAFGAIGAAIALRTGNASVVQGLFPIVFVILFLSTAFFPDNLLLEPAKTIAAWNPLSFIVDGVREPVISVFSVDTFLTGIAGLALLGVVGFALSALAMRHRVRVG
ncbi:MAG: ABC transporter permease [Solirubrobacterales bacterium]